MENAYQPQAWNDLYLMLGGAAAALTGLLIVAMSLHLEEIMKSAAVRRRVFFNVMGLGVIIVTDAFALMPQRPRVFGAEVLVINVPLVCVTIANYFRFRRQLKIDALLRIAAAAVGCLLGVAGGGCLLVLADQGGLLAGMYGIALNSMWMISLIILNAWAIMAGLYREEAAAAESS
jgi:hypothetical protein